MSPTTPEPARGRGTTLTRFVRPNPRVEREMSEIDTIDTEFEYVAPAPEKPGGLTAAPPAPPAPARPPSAVIPQVPQQVMVSDVPAAQQAAAQAMIAASLAQMRLQMELALARPRDLRQVRYDVYEACQSP